MHSTFKIRNRTGRVAVGEIREVHSEGVALWKEIMDQQKKVEEEIEQETKQDKGATVLDKGKAKDSTEGFDTLYVQDIIGDVVLDIPNLTTGIDQSIHSPPVEEADKTKLSGQDEVLVEGIPYEDIAHKNLSTPNSNLSQEGKEEEKKTKEEKRT